MCSVTTFVSMWITNTAATTMMIPINFALLQVFEEVSTQYALSTLSLLSASSAYLIRYKLTLKRHLTLQISSNKFSKYRV